MRAFALKSVKNNAPQLLVRHVGVSVHVCMPMLLSVFVCIRTGAHTKPRSPNPSNQGLSQRGLETLFVP
jgi:hypothetical protein